MDIEQRFQSGNLELRAADDGKSRVVGGYAVVFDELSEVLGAGFGGGFREKIAPEAVDNVDLTRTVALFNHDSSRVLGSAASGTLQLQRDDVGLRFSVDLPDTSFADDLYSSLKRGDIAGSSFGFTIGEDGETWDTDGDVPIRTVTAIRTMPEISVGVVFPAYPQSSSVVERCARAVEQKRQTLCEKSHESRLRTLRLIRIGGPF